MADRHIQHPAQLAEHIAALAASLGSKRKRVSLALPAEAVFTRRMQVPAHVGATALEELIAAEAGGYLTLTPDQVRVDYQFSGADADDAAQLEIVLAAARREQVEDRIAAVEAAGLTPVVLDIDLYAAYAACVTTNIGFAPAGREVAALLICDAIRTQIALFDRRQLLYHRELPGCGPDADAPRIAAAATRALPLATPAGMTLSHIFIGGERGASKLAAISRSLQILMAQSEQLEQSIRSTQPAIGCSVAQPFSAMPADKAAFAAMAGDENASTANEPNHGMAAERPSQSDDADHSAAYLVACGLAMRRGAP